MATFGGYETVHEIYRHGLGSVSRAKVANPTEGTNGQPDYVVKAFQPPYRIAGQDAIKPAVRSFLDRARTQQDVVTAGAKHWAPIYEAGAARDGAYYVTAYYSRTALKLISGRVKLTSQALYAIIKSVLQGLAELKQHSGQPHGNLKPANVLVTGEGEIDEGKIFLTDPASREQLPAADGEGADLACVGELLYQLVLHRPFRGSQSYPIMDSPEWGRLGKKADGWRQFCNQLLNPGGPSLRIEGALRQLENLREKKRIVSGRWVRAASLAAVLAVAVFVGWEYVQFRSEWKQFCLKYDDWYYRLDNQLRADRTRLTRLNKTDSYLAGALGDLESSKVELDPKKIAGNELLVITSLAERPPLSITAVFRTRAALDTLRRFESQISPGQWPILQKLSEHEKLYEQRHWTSAANYLRQFIESVSPATHGDLLTQLDRLAGNEDRLYQDMADIDDRWEVITSTEKTIRAKAPGDKVLATFSPFARHYVENALSNPAPTDLDVVRRALVPVAQLAEEVNNVLKSEWTDKIDRDRFASEGAVYRKAPGSQSEAIFWEWVRESRDFDRYKLDRGSEAISQLEKMTDQVNADIRGLKSTVPGESPDALNQFSQKLGRASGQINELLERQWVKRDLQTDRISRAANEIQVTLKNLRNEISLEQSKNTKDKKTWIENYSKAISDSPAVNLAWDDWRKRFGIDETMLRLSPTEYLDVRARAEKWSEALRDVEKEFPPAPSQMGQFEGLVKSRREEKLAGAIAAAAPAGKEPNLEALKSEAARAGHEYAAWCADLSAVLADAGAVQKLLDGGFGPGDAQWSEVTQFKEKWPPKDVWRDVSSQPPVGTVTSRIDALLRIPGLSRSDLAGRASVRPAPSLDYLRTAWLTLGRATSPAWPATPEEMTQELAIRRNMAAGIDALSDAFRKKALSEEVAAQGPGRLATYLNTAALASVPVARLDANIRAADTAMGAMGVSAAGTTGFERCRLLARIEGLTPAARANVLIYGLRVESAGALTPERFTAVAAAFKADASGLPPETRSRLEGIMKEFSRPNTRDSAAGPPSNAWQMKPLDAQERRVQFTRIGTTETLEFILLDNIPNEVPVYLCTTELSLGTFVAAVRPGDWGQTGVRLLWEYPAGNDPRPGPRVWEWNKQGVGPIRSSDYWLRERKSNDNVFDYFEPEPQYFLNHWTLPKRYGDDPRNRPKLPMQYLPAHTAMYVASLLGCRLPTSEEWNAARKINVTQQGATSNLRDPTWQKQQAYVLQHSDVLQWPDAGAFWPKDYKGPAKTGAAAQSHPSVPDDHVLWFRDVDSEDKQLFHNLIGNVWEYLWEDPAALEAMPDKSLQGYKALLDAHPNGIFVIGDSALSAPELRGDIPQPVDLTHTAASAVDGQVGYADVGMRLAFTARPKTAAQRLKWLMASQTYINATDAPTTRRSN